MGFHFYYHGKEYDFVNRWMDDDALREHAQKVCEENDVPYVTIRFGFDIIGAYEREV